LFRLFPDAYLQTEFYWQNPAVQGALSLIYQPRYPLQATGKAFKSKQKCSREMWRHLSGGGAGKYIPNGHATCGAWH